MKNKHIPFVLLLTFLLILSSCAAPEIIEPSPADSVTAATASRYMENEIMEYEGMRLDPAVGPRDNSISGIQAVDIETYVLRVSGLVEMPASYAYEEVLSLPSYERLITLHCVEGWKATVLWKGVLLEDLIEPATPMASANTVIFHCQDGYTTSMPLSSILDNRLILAYSSNGVELPPALGYPFIVVAEDKLGYKWARWVTEIELSGDPEYKGYWESAGYDNDASLK